MVQIYVPMQLRVRDGDWTQDYAHLVGTSVAAAHQLHLLCLCRCILMIVHVSRHSL